MSVDWLFLFPVPAAILSDAYLEVDECWKGQDYVIEAGDRWDPRLERDAKRRRDMAFAFTSTHLIALQASRKPRDILVMTDAAAPDERPRTYAQIRALWLEAGAFALPDVVDDVVASSQTAPLTPADVRIPFPEGTVRARLRRLDALYALEQMGRRQVSPEGVRAGVVFVDVNGTDLAVLAKHYRKALRALGMRPREDKPSKWVEGNFVQMKGRSAGIEVSITARPAPPDATKVSVLWIERLDVAAPK